MVQIIAEAGVDHEGSKEGAFQLLKAAHEAGADVFKIQYYKKGLRGPSRELPWLEPDVLFELKEVCEETYAMEFLVTPHDEWALDFLLKELDPKRIKIGSGDWHLLEKAKESNKPLIVSTGMHDRLGIKELYDSLRTPNKLHTIMHCISEYFTLPKNAQLGFLKYLQELGPSYTYKIGYSDHTQGYHIALAAIGMGAEVIEKHLTLTLYIEGKQDTWCSLNPWEFRDFVKKARDIEKALSGTKRVITEGEKATMKWVEERNR